MSVLHVFVPWQLAQLNEQRMSGERGNECMECLAPLGEGATSELDPDGERPARWGAPHGAS